MQFRRGIVPLLFILANAVVLGWVDAGAQASQDRARRLAQLRREMESLHPPSNSEISTRLNAIAMEFLEAEDYSEATELLSEAVGRDPDNGVALANLIVCHVKQENWEFASFYLGVAKETVTRRNPDPRVYLAIGELYAAHNLVDDAVAAWDYYRQLGGSDPGALARLDRAKRELAVTPDQTLLQSDHFALYTDTAISPEAAARVEEYLERQYSLQSGFFATALEETQIVILYGGRAYFSLVSVPTWVSALFDGKIRVAIEPGGGLAPELERVLAHELAHAFIRQVSRDRAPGWLHEGLAQWWEGKRITPGEFRQAFVGQSPHSLSEMEGNLAKRVDRSVARANYAEALGLVEYLIDHHGQGSVVCILSGLADGLSTEEALRRETALTPERLISAWKIWAGL
jgi:tetratricopeptide (TPR) repeat protein